MDGPRYDPRRLGADGEAVAARWYEERGYQVLARNWRCSDGELDLILSQGTVVVMCEVKTRSTARFGSPFEAVGPRSSGACVGWPPGGSATRRPFRPDQVRFDVAGVVGRKVEVIEAAL